MQWPAVCSAILAVAFVYNQITQEQRHQRLMDFVMDLQEQLYIQSRRLEDRVAEWELMFNE